MLHKVENDLSGTDLDYIENLEVIYSSALKECIRAVSIDCKERGILLDKVWKGYI